MKVKEIRAKSITLRREHKALVDMICENEKVRHGRIVVQIFDNGITVKCATEVKPKPIQEHGLVLSDKEAIDLGYLLSEIY